MIEHAVLHNAVLQQLQEETVVCSENQTVVAMTPLPNGGVSVEGADGQCITVDCIIAADGSHSATRRLAGIGVNYQGDTQSAIVATLALARPHEATAYQQFTPEGILAFLPLFHPNWASLVLSCTPAQAKKYQEYDQRSFESFLNQITHHAFGDIQLLTERYTYPVEMQQAKHYYANGCYCVGDAAHVIHPLAGQGLNLGIVDVHSLVSILTKARTQHQLLTAPAVQQSYQSARQGQNAAMARLMQGIQTLYAGTHPAVPVIRRWTTGLVSRFPPLQRLLIDYANGKLLPPS